MPITLKSTGGGSVSIDVPSTGATFTLTAPANNATIFTTDGGAITGNVAFTSNNVSIGGQTISPAVGMRNRIINGNMLIDQRNAGSSVTPTNASYTLDRWSTNLTQASKFTVQQNAGSVTPPAGFTKYLGVTSSSAYAVLTGDVFAVRQIIEGLNVADLAWGTSSAKTVTLSFWVRSSLTGTFGGSIQNYAQNRSYPFTYTISSANTWTYITITIPGDTTGTWVTDSTGGTFVNFGLGLGATYSGTAGSWAGADYRSATGGTSVVGTNAATFYITGVQLEVGSVATPFETRPYGAELALCQRYFQMMTPTDSTIAVAGRWGAYVIGFTFATPVSLRTTPSINSSGTFSIVGNGLTETFTSPALGSWTSMNVTLIKSSLTNNPSATAPYFVYIPGGGGAFVSLSSEI